MVTETNSSPSSLLSKKEVPSVPETDSTHSPLKVSLEAIKTIESRFSDARQHKETKGKGHWDRFLTMEKNTIQRNWKLCKKRNQDAHADYTAPNAGFMQKAVAVGKHIAFSAALPFGLINAVYTQAMDSAWDRLEDTKFLGKPIEKFRSNPKATNRTLITGRVLEVGGVLMTAGLIALPIGIPAVLAGVGMMVGGMVVSNIGLQGNARRYRQKEYAVRDKFDSLLDKTKERVETLSTTINKAIETSVNNPLQLGAKEFLKEFRADEKRMAAVLDRQYQTTSAHTAGTSFINFTGKAVTIGSALGQNINRIAQTMPIPAGIGVPLTTASYVADRSHNQTQRDVVTLRIHNLERIAEHIGGWERAWEQFQERVKEPRAAKTHQEVLRTSREASSSHERK